MSTERRGVAVPLRFAVERLHSPAAPLSLEGRSRTQCPARVVVVAFGARKRLGSAAGHSQKSPFGRRRVFEHASLLRGSALPRRTNGVRRGDEEPYRECRRCGKRDFVQSHPASPLEHYDGPPQAVNPVDVQVQPGGT